MGSATSITSESEPRKRWESRKAQTASNLVTFGAAGASDQVNEPGHQVAFHGDQVRAPSTIPERDLTAAPAITKALRRTL
jgi:hypothetical protein